MHVADVQNDFHAKFDFELSDVYSFGISLFELINLEFVHLTRNPQNQLLSQPEVNEIIIKKFF